MSAYYHDRCAHKWYTVPVTSSDPKVTCIKVCEKCGAERAIAPSVEPRAPEGEAT